MADGVMSQLKKPVMCSPKSIITGCVLLNGLVKSESAVETDMAFHH
jgi:hypothetical protein